MLVIVDSFGLWCWEFRMARVATWRNV